MRYRILLVALLKGLIFIGPLLLVSIVLKNSPPVRPNYLESRLASIPAQRTDTTTVFFLGTSRVRDGISTNVMEGLLPSYDFINLGISSSDFLYSCQVATHVLEGNAEKRIVFIELSGLLLLPPESFELLMTRADVNAVIAQHLRARCSLKDVGELLYYSFNITEDIKQILSSPPGLNRMEASHTLLTQEMGDVSPAILKPEIVAALVTKKEPSVRAVALYLETIQRLEVMAKQNGHEVVWLLPLAINKDDEFDLDIAVYSQISEDRKWRYSDRFLISMDRPEYFADATHLNREGASRYSLELAEFIREKFGTSSGR